MTGKPSAASLVVLIVIIVGGLYLWQSQRHEEAIAQEREHVEERERKLEKVVIENVELRRRAEEIAAQGKASRAQAVQAEEAKRMAELTAEKTEQERQKRIDELSERLVKEADERRKAEATLVDLKEKLQALGLAQMEAREKLLALEAARTETEVEDRTDAMKQLERVKSSLRDRESEIAQLRMEQKNLEKRYEEALRRQISTGEEIIRESSKGDRPVDLISLIRALLEALGIKKNVGEREANGI